jgi:UDP-glucose 4-epimerase
MTAEITRWNDAPLWNPDSIADATKIWFKYLGDGKTNAT